jgi:CheY-like chemotaxis protein
VLEAESGDQALEMIEHIADIAILVSDVIMPGGMNGCQLAETVLARRPQLRVLLMSGYSEDNCPAASNQQLPILAKPFGRVELGRALQATQKEKA